MLRRVMGNGAFWVGLVLLLAGIGLNLVNAIAGLVVLLVGVVLLMAAVGVESKRGDVKDYSYSREEKSKTIDLG